jgi:hypothetical protein
MHSTPVVGIALSSVVDGISLSSVAVVAAVAAHLDLGLKATVSVDLMCALGSWFVADLLFCLAADLGYLVADLGIV